MRDSPSNTGLTILIDMCEPFGSSSAVATVNSEACSSVLICVDILSTVVSLRGAASSALEENLPCTCLWSGKSAEAKAAIALQMRRRLPIAGVEVAEGDA